MSTLLVLLVALMAYGSACGSSTDGETGGDQNDSTTTGQSGEVMNVLDAAAQPDGTIVTVTGFLIEDTGTLYIADLIAESFPPQPGGPTLEVEGLDLSEYDGINEEGPVRWRDEPGTITATVEGGKLVKAGRADN